ncbi:MULTISPECIES: hypothetical protein [Bradyrhizobium]|jgi:hypothetical protein|uniref:hypothetical protein n=1 Tax=Bradyrhizobium TaxID=374 RepID=UPI0003F60148|nr:MULTISPECIES: hypothetical protein [Bradyrhizobium]UFW52783.1 hypothetical protein BaraCB756_18005 [Bradyrhizobium arachidis]
MTVIEKSSTVLNWSVMTVKRPGLSRDLPSGNPDLMWVANSSTEATASPRELYEAMLELYPDRANPVSLWSGANAAKEQKS